MKKLTLFLLVSIFFAFSGISYGQSYFSLYGGGAIPDDVDWTDNVGINSAGTISLDNNPTFGFKTGVWFSEGNAPFIGLELDGNVHFPQWSNITTSKAFGVNIIPTSATAKADSILASGLVNLLLRYPHGPIRPYGGVGAGFAFWAIGDQTISAGTFKSETDTALAWDILAGIDFHVSNAVSLFAEYKYFVADFSFPDNIGMDIDYRASLLYGGIIFHF